MRTMGVIFLYVSMFFIGGVSAVGQNLWHIDPMNPNISDLRALANGIDKIVTYKATIDQAAQAYFQNRNHYAYVGYGDGVGNAEDMMQYEDFKKTCNDIFRYSILKNFMSSLINSIEDLRMQVDADLPLTRTFSPANSALASKSIDEIKDLSKWILNFVVYKEHLSDEKNNVLIKSYLQVNYNDVVKVFIEALITEIVRLHKIASHKDLLF